MTRFFCSFSLALLTEAKLLSLASISSLKALETVNFNSLFLTPDFIFFPSFSPLSLLVALCSANFLLSKSFIAEGIFVPNDGFKGFPRFEDVIGFDFEIEFLKKLSFF